ncbi:Alpha/Beta hydrolase protein [Dunaliella salina]|uniref:Alpha/Beta hydrolase protein n=1 Tax=Dunaliella salina TaxID=3046 RepID=A0ABQ7GM39_DUNSA|nr:Alpha/Beta hydrolase protein [Dunaliella salina]|eukprot:KAF5835648.1 Alpha/Beta hydrolase protein [Dunaliella salina]
MGVAGAVGAFLIVLGAHAAVLLLYLLVLILATPVTYLLAVKRRGWRAASLFWIWNLDNLIYLQESSWREHMLNSSYQHEQTSITYYGDEKIQASVHGILARKEAAEGQVQRRPLLFVHGMGGSALDFSKAMNTMISEYDVYAMELPGFYPRSPFAAAQTLTQTGTVIDFYCSCIKTFIEKYHLEEVTVVAHADAAFFGVHFIHRYPELAGKLILVNPSGIFPTDGEGAAVWGFWMMMRLTKLTLGQSLLRGLAWFSSCARACLLRASTAGEAFIKSQLANDQDTAVQCGIADGFGASIATDHVKAGVLTATWTQPVLPILLASKVPFAFI